MSSATTPSPASPGAGAGDSTSRTTQPSSRPERSRAPRSAAVKVASPHCVGGNVLTKPNRAPMSPRCLPVSRTAPAESRLKPHAEIIRLPGSVCARPAVPRQPAGVSRERPPAVRSGGRPSRAPEVRHGQTIPSGAPGRPGLSRRASAAGAGVPADELGQRGEFGREGLAAPAGDPHPGPRAAPLVAFLHLDQLGLLQDGEVPGQVTGRQAEGGPQLAEVSSLRLRGDGEIPSRCR